MAVIRELISAAAVAAADTVNAVQSNAVQLFVCVCGFFFSRRWCQFQF